jgi:hypothetical protein
MIGWWRFHSSRATAATAPLAGAVDIAPSSPHRCSSGCRLSGRPTGFTGISAVYKGRAGHFFLAARPRGAGARRPYRPETLIPRCTGRAAGAGLVAPTGRTFRGDGLCSTGRTFPDGPNLPAVRRFRPVLSRPYRWERGLRRAGHGAVPAVHVCRPRPSCSSWWPLHNKLLKQMAGAMWHWDPATTGPRPPLLSRDVGP